MLFRSQSFRWIFRVDFRIDWFDPFAVQGTLKSLFQHQNSKASILRHSAFFMVQLSHPYMTTEKTIALTIQPFVCILMYVIFNTLSRIIIAFLPRSEPLKKLLYIKKFFVKKKKGFKALNGTVF